MIKRGSDHGSQFPIVWRGYDRSHVDGYIADSSRWASQAWIRLEQLEAEVGELLGEVDPLRHDGDEHGYFSTHGEEGEIEAERRASEILEAAEARAAELGEAAARQRDEAERLSGLAEAKLAKAERRANEIVEGAEARVAELAAPHPQEREDSPRLEAHSGQLASSKFRLRSAGRTPLLVGAATVVALLALCGALIAWATTSSHRTPAVSKFHGVISQDVAAESRSDQPLDPVTRAALQQQLVQARAFAMRYPTVSDAIAAHYHLGGGFAPRRGATYISYTGLTLPGAFDPNRPEALVYNGTSPTSQVIGLVYFAPSDQAPQGFAGPNDHWQRHADICIKNDSSGVGALFPADADVTAARCSSVQGTFYRAIAWTVHAWVVPSWENPLGVFSPDNPDVRCADGTYNTDRSGFCQGT